jgi:hypothetical protein
MLGRKTYERDELDRARTIVARQLVAYERLLAGGAGDDTARADFEPLFFGNLVLVLDRLFVHRVRLVTGKDCNPLNEVEILVDSLIGNDAVLRVGTVVAWVPESTVLGLRPGDPVRLSGVDFERLSGAFFAELEKRFVAA